MLVLLRDGTGHIDKSLQQEWNQHGEAAFQYEILETLEDELHSLAIADLLKQTRDRWVKQLSATALLLQLAAVKGPNKLAGSAGHILGRALAATAVFSAFFPSL